MKRLLNRPDRVVPELLDGLVAVHPLLTRLPDRPVIVRFDADVSRFMGHVALVSGGGAGHEPAHAGYVGSGMLSAAVAGDVFTSPPPDAVLAAIRAVGGPAGVLLIVKNYTGDRLNFGLAAELARAGGIPVELVIVADDVAIPPGEAGRTAGPRGLAGTVLVHKVAGAAAEAGASLAEVAAEARAAAASVATMGVALTPCTVPAAGKPGFALADDEVELGLGIHGEPGVRRAPLEPADALVARLLDAILAARSARLAAAPEAPGDGRVALLVNGLGGATPLELAIVARGALAHLAAAGLTVERAYVGTFLSALEMGGVSLSVLDLDDARLARLDAPTLAPAWPHVAPLFRVPPPAVEAPGPAEPARETKPTPPRTAGGRRLASALARACRALIADAPRLTGLDQAVGDGDLGISLERGAGAVLAALPGWPVDDPAATFHALADTLQRSLGGTSGPLYAVAALRAAGALAGPRPIAPNEPNDDAGRSAKTASGSSDLEGADAPDAAAPNEANFDATSGRNEHNDPVGPWLAALRAAVAGIADLGGAGPGDRTMLDALYPALDAFARSAGTNPTDLPAAARAAAEAAAAGAAATAGLAPRRGRSSYIGDRALGHPDPGAVAVATWLRALVDPG